MQDRPSIIKAPCNDCGRDTDHEVLKSHNTSGHDPESETHWSTTFDMIECRGCHFISLKRTFDFSEYDQVQVDYFPPPVPRRKPDWGHHFLLNASSEIQELLVEVYSALHAGNRRLATMGARALLDMAIVAAVGDVGDFKRKLDQLESGGFIGKQPREFLGVALDAGNAAAHRGHCPTPQQLNMVMDIVENVLEQIFVLPHAAEDLKKSIPPRHKGER